VSARGGLVYRAGPCLRDRRMTCGNGTPAMRCSACTNGGC